MQQEALIVAAQGLNSTHGVESKVIDTCSKVIDTCSEVLASAQDVGSQRQGAGGDDGGGYSQSNEECV